MSSNRSLGVAIGSATQRFAIVLMLYGGFYELSQHVGPRIMRFPYEQSTLILTLAMLLGILGFGFELISAWNESERR